MKSIFIFITFVGLLIGSKSDAKDARSLAGQIAEILNYPVEKIVVADESAYYVKETEGEAIFVFGISSSEESTFAPMSIAIGNQGTLLKAKLKEECEEFIKAHGEKLVKRIKLRDGIYGYGGLVVMGPGGSGERILVTWPARGVDLQIGITVPRDGIGFNDSTEAYCNLIMNGGPNRAERLVRCMERLVDYVERADIRGSSVVEQAKPSPTASSTPSPTPLPSPSGTQSGTSKSEDDAVRINKTKGENVDATMPWVPVSASAIIAMGLIWLLLGKRKSVTKC